jgi:prepilin-type processing-associated H-X9-DG protein
MTNDDGTPNSPIGNPKDIGASYVYLGWVFDRLNVDFIPIDQYPMVSTFIQIIGGTMPTGAPVPIQFGAGLNKLFTQMTGPFAAHNGIALMQIADQDQDIGQEIQGEGHGSGGGNIIYRLREGIERFLITDINNPGASAQAQSAVFVMMDQLGTANAVSKFNHVPGGCNVLYMDGHVSFIRYVSEDAGATPPVTPSVARLVGAIASGA